MQKITTTTIAGLTSRAQKVFGDMAGAEAAVYRDVKLSCYYAWLFGRMLWEVKSALEHGTFESWRASAFPKLSDTKAQRCQALYKWNAKASELKLLNEKNVAAFVAKLDPDSVRKYQLGYVSEKEKPALTGRDDAGGLTDVNFDRPRSVLKCVNEFAKWKQQFDQGITGEELPQIRVELREPFTWMLRDVFASDIITLDDGRKAVIIAE